MENLEVIREVGKKMEVVKLKWMSHMESHCPVVVFRVVLKSRLCRGLGVIFLHALGFVKQSMVMWKTSCLVLPCMQ